MSEHHNSKISAGIIRRFHLVATGALIAQAASEVAVSIVSSAHNEPTDEVRQITDRKIERLLQAATAHEHDALHKPLRDVAEMSRRHREQQAAIDAGAGKETASEAREVADLIDTAAHVDRGRLLELVLGELGYGLPEDGGTVPATPKSAPPKTDKPDPGDGKDCG